MKACRKPVAPPSTRTMRPPTASLPRLRPREAVSTTVGITTITSTSTTIEQDRHDGLVEHALRDQPRRHEREQHEDDHAEDHVDEHAEGAQEVAERLHVEGDGFAGEHLVLMDLDRMDARGGTFDGHGYSKANGSRRPDRRAPRRVGATRRARAARATSAGARSTSSSRGIARHPPISPT